MAAVIRLARESDARGIAKVQLSSWHAAYRGIVDDDYLNGLDLDRRETRHRERLLLPPETRPLVYVAEKMPTSIIGFISGGAPRVETVGFEAEMYALYLSPECQRQGVGSRLVKSFVTALLGQDRKTMFVRVLAANQGARAFYEALGGTYLSEQPREIGGVEYPEVSYGWSNLAALVGQ